MKISTPFSTEELKSLPIYYWFMRKELRKENHEISEDFKLSHSRVHRTKEYGVYGSNLPSSIEGFVVIKKNQSHG